MNHFVITGLDPLQHILNVIVDYTINTSFKLFMIFSIRNFLSMLLSRTRFNHCNFEVTQGCSYLGVLRATKDVLNIKRLSFGISLYASLSTKKAFLLYVKEGNITGNYVLLEALRGGLCIGIIVGYCEPDS